MSSSPCTYEYHLEMRSPGALISGKGREGLRCSLISPGDPALSQRFYRGVGEKWQWTDRAGWSVVDWQRHLETHEVWTFLGELHGEEIGYAELEVQAGGQVEIVYFGLLPEWIGKKLGGVFLTEIVKAAWEIPATERVWVHTCTLDHPAALSNYEARGFSLFRTEVL